jgi:uncharacterized membrane protein YkvA (DUF1232 family)
MAGKSFKIVFELDEEDAKHFRSLFRKAKTNASKRDPDEVVAEARALVKRVRDSKKVPPFVIHAIEPLEDLIHAMEDEDWKMPASVRKDLIAALAYFADPEDLIPDSIPALGFLDDAIMTRFLEEQFEAEIWGYRKFRTFRERAEHRPWTSVAKDRLPKRLDEERKKIRDQVNERRQKKKKGLFGIDW